MSNIEEIKRMKDEVERLKLLVAQKGGQLFALRNKGGNNTKMKKWLVKARKELEIKTKKFNEALKEHEEQFDNELGVSEKKD